MKWIIHYDIVAFAIISVIIVVYSIYNQLNTFPNRVYRKLLFVSLFSVLTDIASAYACSFCTKEQLILNYFINIIHFVVQNLVPCLYCLFAYSLVHETGKIEKKDFAYIFVPYFFNLILILSTPFTGACFYIDEMGVYHRGLGQFFVYTIALYYIILGLAIVIKNLKVLGIPQRLCVFLYSFECIILNILQLFYSEYLLQEIGVAFAMFFIYITMQNPLEYMDVQTGVYNRNLFKKVINGKLFKKEDFSLLCAQIEGLSYINEKFSLHSGNILLKQISSFLLSFDKSAGVYRISNRQFVLIVPKASDLSLLSYKILERFAQSFYLSNINLSVNLWTYLCCIQSSKNISSISDVFDIIDYSLKQAKEQKKNSLIYASTESLEKRHREMEVAQAISNAIRKSSFQVYFQPIFSVKENKYTNMEALVRLIDDNIGFVPPDEFIPIAERNGDILIIGEIVLEKVCGFVEQYHPEDFGIRAIHVNLSVVQCMQENISSRLLNIIDKYQIPHKLIDFEITETTADNTSGALYKIMKDFNERGIHFSLDDFGTGYSNQSNIMQYPYSIVKIDKSMVWACDSNPKALISLKHTIAMIKDLEMSALAEGVETERHLEFLKEIGVEYLQGYYFSHPLPVVDLIPVIKETRIRGNV